MMHLVVITLLTLLPFTYSAGCPRFTDGAYCKHDLSGYIKCGGSWYNPTLEKDVTCPTGTKCACFLYNACWVVPYKGDYGIDEKDICQNIQTASPLKEVMHLQYRYGGWEMGDPFEDEEIMFTEAGEIKQDLRTSRRMKTWGDNQNALKFELIIPSNDNSFVKYSGQYPGRCEKSSISKFTAFAGEIQSYRLKSAGKFADGSDKQVWYNQIFRASDDDGLTKKWTVKYDQASDRVVPVRYDKTYTGTQEEQCCGIYMHVNYEEVAVDANLNTDTWFEVPNFCP